MAVPKKKPKFTFEEYLALEEKAANKSEYYQGDIFSIPSGTPEHSLISSNISREMGNALKGKPCLVYDSNLKVRIDAADVASYPDVLVICGEREHFADRKDIVTNPTLIVEVLSEGTAGYDRGTKFQNYGLLPSLQEYVLVEQSHPMVEVFQRNAQGLWVLRRYDGLDSRVDLQSLEVSLAASEIYYGIDFSD